MTGLLDDPTPPPFFPARLAPAIPCSPLALAAQQRLIDSSRQFHDLLRHAPTVRQVIRELLRQRWQVDPDTSGLVFEEREVSFDFVSLTHLAAFMHSHGDAGAQLAANARIRSAQPAPMLDGLTPAELLGQLAAMDLPGALGSRWRAYWETRAPGTPSSRLEHGRRLYQTHFLAALELASLGMECPASLASMLDALLEDTGQWSSQGLSVQASAVASVPGALLFTLRDEPAQLLYRPDQAPSVVICPTREVLQARLGVPPGQALDGQPVTAIDAGFEAWHRHWLDKLNAALAHDPGASLRRDAAFALVIADDLALAWYRDALLAAPAGESMELEEAVAPSLFDFGALTSDIPSPLRSHLIARQLASLSAAAERQPGLVEQAQADLQAARAMAQAALEPFLQAPHWHSSAESVGAPAELVRAHHAGLRAHARLQRLLGQLDEAELTRVEAISMQASGPLAAVDQVIASRLLMQQVARPEQELPASEAPVHGALIISQAPTAAGEAAEGGLLLYWPGEHGGLLRLRSQVELEQCLGVRPEQGQRLRLEAVTGDAIADVLEQLLAQARELARQVQDQQGLAAVARELPALRECLAQRLRVPRHAAREQALALLAQQRQVLEVAGATPEWLKRLPDASRDLLKSLVETYIAAAGQARALLERDLPDRRLFCRQQVTDRLRQDFPAYDGTAIRIELPTSTRWIDDPIAGSGAPGVPIKRRLVPGEARETLPLEDLLLHNVDEPTALRLRFMRLLTQSADGVSNRALEQGLTAQYIRRLAGQLDLATAYESIIRAAYGGLEETPHARAHRRECLLRPLQAMLRIQGVLLHGQGHLDSAARQSLQRAIDTPGAPGLRLLAALLTTGGPDTEDRPVTLSGITFIEDQASGLTLLYRPEHLDKPIRQYPSLEDARWALYQECAQEREIAYLADRALLGDPAAHRWRIRQARIRGFDAIIAVGARWPAHLTLPELLLEAQMGRLIEAHRASSRSNHDLWMRQFAYESRLVFNYLKMALSVVPFVGTVIGLYDFLDATAESVSSFIEGETARGIAALNDALLAFIDAAMDLVPGAALDASALRRAVQRRHMAQLGAGAAKAWRPDGSASQKLQRLAGYEHARPLLLQGLQPGNEGRYRGVYRHSEGDFILIEGRPFQVRWDATAHTWRLQGNRNLTWQRAVALDENGQWDTHMALYGVHVLGGGSAGGQTLGRLADRLDPYWPAAVRERLPRFLVDRHYRRQRMLQAQAFADEARTQDALARSNALFEIYERSTPEQKLAQLPALLDACHTDIRLAKQLYRSWDDYLPLTAGRNRQIPMQQKGRVAKLICERLLSLLELQALRSQALLWEGIKVKQAIGRLPNLREQLPALRQLRRVSIEQLAIRERLFQSMDELASWYPLAERSTALRTAFERTRDALSSELRAFFQTHHLIHAAHRHENMSVVAQFLLERLKTFEDEALDLHGTLLDLHSVKVSTAERRTIHQQARSAFELYKKRLQATHSTLADLFDEHYFKLLQDNLDTLIEISDRKLRRLPALEQMRQAPARSPRLFLTVDGQLKVGDFIAASGNRPEQIVMRGDDGQVLRRFERAQGDRWQLQQAARKPREHELRELRMVAREVTAQLDDYRRRIQSYQRQGMLAADLEHMLVIKAEDLESYASRLLELDPGASEAARLREQAGTLRDQGKAMRVTQIKQSQTPGEGQLVYLLEQGETSLHRLEQRKRLAERDYLQEYEVRDATAPGQPVIWYAHFHYRSAEAPFEAYTAAHLKRREDRYRGAQWQQANTGQDTIWRGPIGRQVAMAHFAGL